jgi:hypothetical protein
VTDQLEEQVPGPDVGTVVDRVAAGCGRESDRDGQGAIGLDLLAKAEEVGGEEGRPLTDAIDRLARHEEIGEEHEQGGNGREFGT